MRRDLMIQREHDGRKFDWPATPSGCFRTSKGFFEVGEVVQREGAGVDTTPFTVTQEQKDVWDHNHQEVENEYEEWKHDQEMHVNSMVFNTFIFAQVFNEINSRKIRDEYNIFERFLENNIFISVIIITIALQCLWMFTPLSAFFEITYLR